MRSDRRGFVTQAVLGSAVMAGTRLGLPSRPRRGIPPLRQGVCRWPFASMPLDPFCRLVKELGFGAVDLVDRPDWPTVQGHGLAVSTANSTPRRDFITRGLNDPANHPLILGELEAVLPAAAAAGIPNVIAMVGNRGTATDEEAIGHCATALAHVAPLAERHGVTIVLEMLNSKVDHRGFQGDTTAFGVAICERVASPRVRLLYDIYHMQIMEGDVIRTIRTNAQWFAHYHTAGNPGRHELDGHQELQYPAIAEAIQATGFTGWLAHEFLPTRAVAEGLTQARNTVAV